jgi:DNA-binding response OmpR family regulator
MAMLMTHALTRAGCRVQAAYDGKQGVERAQETKFDLIILGVDLPNISNFEICQELRQRHICRHTPIILVTGDDRAETRQHGLEMGAADCITKPFEVADFISRVKSCVSEEVMA